MEIFNKHVEMCQKFIEESTEPVEIRIEMKNHESKCCYEFKTHKKQGHETERQSSAISKELENADTPNKPERRAEMKSIDISPSSKHRSSRLSNFKGLLLSQYHQHNHDFYDISDTEDEYSEGEEEENLQKGEADFKITDNPLLSVATPDMFLNRAKRSCSLVEEEDLELSGLDILSSAALSSHECENEVPQKRTKTVNFDSTDCKKKHKQQVSNVDETLDFCNLGQWWCLELKNEFGQRSTVMVEKRCDGSFPCSHAIQCKNNIFGSKLYNPTFFVHLLESNNILISACDGHFSYLHSLDNAIDLF